MSIVVYYFDENSNLSFSSSSSSRNIDNSVRITQANDQETQHQSSPISQTPETQPNIEIFNPCNSKPPNNPFLLNTIQPNPSQITHITITRSKAGIFKPKAYAAVLMNKEPGTIQKVMADQKWFQAIKD